MLDFNVWRDEVFRCRIIHSRNLLHRRQNLGLAATLVAIAALAIGMTAGLLVVQPGGSIGTPHGIGVGGDAVPDAWPLSSDIAFTWLLSGYAFAQLLEDAFVTTWKTDSAGQSITIPVGGATGNYTVDWGDGTMSENVTGDQMHPYASAGNHTVRISGNFTMIYLNNDLDNAPKLVSIDQWGAIKWESTARAFYGASDMVYKATDVPDLSEVTDMVSMFHDARNFNGNISNWDVSNVTDMNSLFEGARNFNQPLNDWDVSNVDSMANMFDGATTFDQNLGEWYVVPADTAFNAGDASLNVTTISAQNGFLDDQRPRYGIGAGQNSTLFNVTGNTLMFKSPTDPGNYRVNVTASGPVFESSNNWRVLGVTVSGTSDFAPTASAGPDLVLTEGAVFMLNGSATDPNGGGLTYLWTQSPASTVVAFSDTSSPTATITVPQVTANTNVTLTLTATNTSLASATDSLVLAIRETGSAFLTTWNVTETGTTVSIPTYGAYEIIWGDGSAEAVRFNGLQSHSYSAAGMYQVAMTSGLSRIGLSGSDATPKRLASIDQWGEIQWTSMQAAFQSASAMTYGATDAPDLSGVTSMVNMFWGATSFNGNISSWDVSNVVNMNSMFTSATSFNGNISSWDVSNVVNMNSMFTSATSFNGNISSWDVSRVTDMAHMFNGATSFNGNISSWDVSRVTDMVHMFYGATSFNHDISSWDVSRVTDMRNMFRDATSFNGNISSWDVSRVTDMSGMFYRATSFNGNISSWDVSSVTDMYVMFYRATSFNQDISSWDVSDVAVMRAMFQRATSFNGNISSWDVSSVTDIRTMFQHATSFNQDISSWDVSDVAVMHAMFQGASAFDQNLGNWYVVLDDTVIFNATETLAIRAQNSWLDNRNPTYGLGTGGDSDLFVITGDILGRNSTVDYSGKTGYSVNITSTGDFGTSNYRIYDITVTGEDTIPDTVPTVTSIERSNPVAETTSAQTLVFAVTFSEDVTDVDAGDFALSSDSTGTGSVTNLVGSGSQYLVGVSTTQDGTYNLDLVSSGHGITDESNNPLTNVIPTTGTDETYTVNTVPADTTAPTLSSIERYNPSTENTDSQTLTYKVTFSEDVTGVDTTDFTLSSDSTGGSSSAQFTQTRSPAIAITAANTITDTITVTGSGTVMSVSVAVDVSHTYKGDLKVDLIAPDGTIKTVHNRSGGSADDIDQTYTPDFAGVSIAGTWTLRINDNYAAADDGTLNSWTLTINSGSSSGTSNPVTSISGSGDTYQVTVSATQDGTYNLDLISSGHGIEDESNNPLTDVTPTTGTDETYTVNTAPADTTEPADTTAPTLSSIERSSPATQNTDNQTLVYEVTFSENVTGVDTTDFALSSDSTGGSSSAQFTQTRSPAIAITAANTITDTITVPDSGTVTSVSVAIDVSHTYKGDLKVDLIAPDGTIKTVHNRSGGSADDIDQTYTPDFAGVPIAGIWTLQINDNYATADDGTLNSWTLTINPDSSSGTSNPVTSISGSGDTYQVTVSATQDGTYNLDLISSGHGIEDESNNPLTDVTPTTGTDETYTVNTVPADTTAPTLSSIERYNPSTENTDNQTLTYKVIFSEDVTGVDTTDFTLSSDSTGGSSSAQFTQTRSPAIAITAANTITDTITVTGSGTVMSVSVAVDVSHTYKGDLKVDLIAPDGTIKTVHNRSGGSADDIDQTYTPDFAGVPIAGIWTLQINDNYATADDGTLNSWTLTINPDNSSGTSNPVTSISGSGDTYQVTVSATQDGTYNLDLISSGHGIEDESNNPLTDVTPTTGTDETYTVNTVPADTTAPTLSSIERYNPSTENTDNQTLTYKVIFSEDVTGVDTTDFTLSSDSTGGSSSAQFTQTRSPAIAITAANTITDTITVTGSGTVMSVSVAVDVSHTYKGDLKVDLIAPDGTIKTVHNRSGGSADDIDQTYTPDFAGVPIAGIWTLQINDNYATADDGTLNSWTLTINPDSSSGTSNPVTSISGSGDTYQVTVSATQDGTYNLDLISSGHGIEDESNNPLTDVTPTTGTDETYTVNTVPADTTAPTLSSIERYNPSTENTDNQTLTYKVIFSEDVTGVDTTDFTLSSDSTGGSSSAQFTQTRSPAIAITAANTITDTITVTGSGTVMSVSVAVDVSHTYKGDLKVDLIAPDGTIKTVHNRSGGSADDIDQTYTPDFAGVPIAGIWTLQINDNYATADDGTLNSWTLTINPDSK